MWFFARSRRSRDDAEAYRKVRLTRIPEDQHGDCEKTAFLPGRKQFMMETCYSKEHEWVMVREGIACIGISEYAANQLGDVTFVELPQVGKRVKQFDMLCSIESVKAASDIYAPVSGKVVKVNDALEETPEIVNESAEDAGWIAWIEMDGTAELGNLMNREEYEEYLRGLE
jgi:glycine cleavage system H protein